MKQKKINEGTLSIKSVFQLILAYLRRQFASPVLLILPRVLRQDCVYVQYRVFSFDILLECSKIQVLAHFSCRNSEHDADIQYDSRNLRAETSDKRSDQVLAARSALEQAKRAPAETALRSAPDRRTRDNAIPLASKTSPARCGYVSSF